MTRPLRLALLVALTAALLAPAGTVLANNRCNSTISTSGAYALLHDHTCPAGTAITIDADFVNLDLGGFQVDGQGTGSIGIDITPGSDGVYIFNGAVRGFDTGIEGGECALVMFPATTNDLFIDNVTVRNSGSDGIRLCHVQGNTQVFFGRVIGAGGTGIHLTGTGAVSSSVVQDANLGIRLEPNADDMDEVYVLASSVDDVTSTGVHISATASTSGALAYAEVRDGRIQGASRGITTLGDANTVISGMAIRGTNLEAIQVLASLAPGESPVTIQDTTITSVGTPTSIDYGGAIAVQDRPAGATITSTVVRNVTDAPGISFSCSTAISGVVESLVRNVDGDGVLVTDATPPGSACLNAVRPEAIFVHDSVIKGSVGSGVVLLTGRGHQLFRNVLRANGVDGAYVAGAVTESFLTDNQSRMNVDDGFQLDTADLELTSNLARGNAGYGFETNFVGPVLVDNVQFSGNNTAGNCSDPTDLPNSAC